MVAIAGKVPFDNHGSLSNVVVRALPWCGAFQLAFKLIKVYFHEKVY